MKIVKVDEETHSELHEIRRMLSSEWNRDVTMNEVISSCIYTLRGCVIYQKDDKTA